jgi:RND family efflux transporter MFP subunit
MSKVQPVLVPEEHTPSESPLHPVSEPTPAHVEEKPSRFMTVGLYVFGFSALGVAILALVLLAGTRQRALAEEVLERKAELAKGPRVRVTQVALAPGVRTVSLPGEVHPWVDSNLYAKVAGYLKEIHVDKGDRVTRGQVIGRLESPEIDQTVLSAKADLELKKVTAQRDHDLLKKGFIDQQDVDTADSLLKQSQAALEAALTMQTYEILHAPFDGVVTTRYADPGALLPAATSSTTAAQPVIEVSDLSHLRIYVYLGQDDAALVKVGDPVKISMDQRPDVVIDARVARLSQSLDPKTRTMLAEVDLDNRKTNIYPGEFLHATLTMHARPFPQIPADGLIGKGKNFFVAVIENDKARFVPVETGQDDGLNVLITSGLKGGEMIALNAAADIEDGGPVQPMTNETAKPAGPATK